MSYYTNYLNKNTEESPSQIDEKASVSEPPHHPTSLFTGNVVCVSPLSFDFQSERSSRGSHSSHRAPITDQTNFTGNVVSASLSQIRLRSVRNRSVSNLTLRGTVDRDFHAHDFRGIVYRESRGTVDHDIPPSDPRFKPYLLDGQPANYKCINGPAKSATRTGA